MTRYEIHPLSLLPQDLVVLALRMRVAHAFAERLDEPYEGEIDATVAHHWPHGVAVLDHLARANRWDLTFLLRMVRDNWFMVLAALTAGPPEHQEAGGTERDARRRTSNQGQSSRFIWGPGDIKVLRGPAKGNPNGQALHSPIS